MHASADDTLLKTISLQAFVIKSAYHKISMYFSKEGNVPLTRPTAIRSERTVTSYFWSTSFLFLKLWHLKKIILCKQPVTKTGR